MLLFYIRHGDPIYTPDKLTPLGHRQAEAVAHRLALYGIDKVFSSDSVRAMQTAQPTCELLHLKKTILPEFHETIAYKEMKVKETSVEPNYYTWPWGHVKLRSLFLSREVRNLGDNWYTHPEVLKIRNFKPAVDRIADAADAWLASLGYTHDRDAARYTVTSENPDERIALFAHEGVGKILLSHILDIPYPLYAPHFDLQHSGMTVIEFFMGRDGLAHARTLTHSNDSHLYRDGLPLDYQHRIRF